MYRLGHAYCLPLRGRRGDACERRLWRRKRARRSGRIKATDKWALPTQTEPLIQQDMSPPYRGLIHLFISFVMYTDHLGSPLRYLLLKSLAQSKRFPQYNGRVLPQ